MLSSRRFNRALEMSNAVTLAPATARLRCFAARRRAQVRNAQAAHVAKQLGRQRRCGILNPPAAALESFELVNGTLL